MNEQILEWTGDHAETLIEYLNRDGYEIPMGMGTVESACSMAAINLVLTGTLTDRTPDCMSLVVGKWIVDIQDAMPTEIRNSSGWKEMLPLAPGTGRQREIERAEILIDWIWGVVLPHVQTVANQTGIGSAWRSMCDEQSSAASYDAWQAAASNGEFNEALSDAARHAHSLPLTNSPAIGALRVAWAAVAAANATKNPRAAWEVFDPVRVLGRLVGGPANRKIGDR